MVYNPQGMCLTNFAHGKQKISVSSSILLESISFL